MGKELSVVIFVVRQIEKYFEKRLALVSS